MVDTQNSPEAQAQTEGDAQPDIGRVITGSIVLDEAQQLAIFRAATEAIVRLPRTSWANKGFLVGLLCRLDFTKGVVRDGHDWLAKWFNTSLSAVRRRRDALDDAGYIHDRECKVDGGNLTNEISLPLVAQVALAMGDARFRTPPGCSISSTNEDGVSSDRLGVLGEENITQPPSSMGEAPAAPSQSKIADDYGGKSKIEQPEPTTLTDWRATDFVRKRVQVPSTITLPDYPDLETWREWLGRHGGAPEHVASWQGLRHALEIAATARQWTGLSVPLHVYAIAYWIAEAHTSGRRIGSLGFVAAKILRRALEGDTSRITDIPTRRDRAILDGWREWAAKQARKVKDAGIGVDVREMQSTWRVEELQDMAGEHGQEALEAAIERVIGNGAAPDLPEGHSICGWRWFRQYIEQPSPRPRPKPETDREYMARMRVHFAQRKAADSARLAEIAKVAAAAVARLEAAGISVDRYVTKRVGDQSRLLVPSQVEDLRSRFPCDMPIHDLANAVAEAVGRFIGDPSRTRTRVTAWSNLGNEIRTVLAEHGGAACQQSGAQREVARR